MRATIPRAVLGAFIATPLVLAACSSGSASSPAASPPSSVGASASAPTAQTHTSAAAAASSAGGGGGVAPAGFCSAVLHNNAFMLDMANGDENPGGIDPQKVLADMQQIADEAPSEVKGDIQQIVDYDKTMFTTKAQPDDQDSPQLDSAMQHYLTWINEHCAGGK